MTASTPGALPDEAIAHIAGVFSSEEQTPTLSSGHNNDLFAVAQIVTQALGAPIKPMAITLSTHVDQAVHSLAQNAQLRVRRVKLTEQWWGYDSGPLLAFDKNSHTPCALIPRKSNGYNLYYASSKSPVRITAENAKHLLEEAYFFYRPMPDKALKLFDIAKFSFHNRLYDFRHIISIQVMISLLGLLVPIVTGALFDTVIPNAAPDLLFQFTIGLTAAILAGSAFTIAQVSAFLRMRFKINILVQSAVWDRLLRLPVDFFRQFTAGDLADRAGGIDSIQQQLAGSVVSTLVGGIMSILTLMLMFYFDVYLALIALATVTVILTVAITVNIIQLYYQREIFSLQGKISGLVLQLINSMSKLKVAHAQSRALGIWAKKFTKKMRYTYKANKLLIGVSIFQNIILMIATVLIFYIVLQRIDSLSFGRFIAFNAAFGQFFAATLAMVGTVSTLIRIIPIYERVKPILSTLPETNQDVKSCEKLSGKIECHKVAFNYETDADFFLKPFSLSVTPGECIAIVGPSGAGKSTLFRLLLGFEQPSAGQVLVDGFDLATLNLRSVRQQMGVVLQNAGIIPGSMLDNILGHKPLTIEDAWEAAELVGLKKDIQAMPMGMHTLVSEGGKTLSGGQRQRLVLARAIVHKPSILLLDEATSALDNVTQAHIQKNINQLNITRIIAAHRLSTIKDADRIFVLDNGEVVQTGTYETLISEPGLFADLARRQLVDRD